MKNACLKLACGAIRPTRNYPRRAAPVERVIPINGTIFLCPHRAAKITGLASSCLLDWAKRAFTSYGYPLNVVRLQGHRLIEERDVRVIARVQRDFPIRCGGPGPRQRQEAMKAYAEQLRAAARPQALVP
jgi:hypothetical protein